MLASHDLSTQSEMIKQINKIGSILLVWNSIFHLNLLTMGSGCVLVIYWSLYVPDPPHGTRSGVNDDRYIVI